MQTDRKQEHKWYELEWNVENRRWLLSRWVRENLCSIFGCPNQYID